MRVRRCYSKVVLQYIHRNKFMNYFVGAEVVHKGKAFSSHV